MSVPVLIIGGFLGAGKTTAVNHLLRHAGERVAVLVNDFGALDIDANLLSGDGEIFALANGCVCCAIGPDFSATLSRILTMAPAPERILVEASGVSDPWRIAQLVKLNRAARLDAVVVLADALELPAQFADRWLRDTLERQIARADIIALSKCDIAGAEAKAAAYAALNAIRPGVAVIEIANGVLPNVLLSTNKDENASALIADAPAHGLRSWSWSPPGALDEARLRTALAGLPSSIWRGKGLLSIGAEKSKRLLQLVGRRWALTAYDGRPTTDRLVLIGTEDMPPDAELAELFVGTLI
jgi:G3E family GTPase